MKFRVTMKTPDALDQAVQEAVLAVPMSGDNSTDIYCQQVDRMIEVEHICEKWFECGEYLTVEIDTDAQTCTVVEQ